MNFDELKLEAGIRIEQLKRRLGLKATVLQGRRPSGLEAAMCYIIGQQSGLSVTIAQVAYAYVCTEVSVYNNVKLLKRLMQNPDMKRDTRRTRE